MTRNGFFFKFTEPPKMDTNGLPKTGVYKVPRFENCKSPTCVDLGSACGGFIAKYHDNFGEIYAVEASYPNFLTTKTVIDELGLNNCVIFNLAASKHTGDIVDISWNSEKRPYGNRIGAHDSHDVGHRVLTVSYGDLFKLINAATVNYLKMDIEGSEFDFLYGQDLSRVDVISLELHQKILGARSRQLVRYIQRQNFKLIYDGGGTNVDLTFENKNPSTQITWEGNFPEIKKYSGYISRFDLLKNKCRGMINMFV